MNKIDRILIIPKFLNFYTVKCEAYFTGAQFLIFVC